MATADMGEAPPAKKKAAGPRRLLSLALTIVFGVGFGALAAVAFAAWARGFLGDVFALVVGFLLAWVLPLVLSVRAVLALKKKNRPLLLRRVVGAFLVVLVQLTVFLAGFVHLGQGTATTSGELAAAALPFFGPVPVVGGVLEKTAKDGGALDVKQPADPKAPKDPTTKDPTTPALATGLSPRAGGRPIGAIAAAAQTLEGDVVVVVWSVAFGGALTSRTIDLGAFAAMGNPTRVEAADDGSVAVILGGAQLLTVKAGAVVAELDKTLSRGSNLSGLDVQQLKDVAIAPGGAVLLTVDAYDSKQGAVRQALLARPPGGFPFIVKKAGDVVDAGAAKGDLQNLSQGYSIKAGSSNGAVVVEEEFLEGEADIGMKMGGAQWVMNPRRLLVGQIDNPRALSELVRTGQDPSGVDNLSLQTFGDATLLPDGRVYFDANFVEEGARGWLFNARSGGGAFAVAPELIGKPEAPFGERGPRLRHFVVDADGTTFAFVNKDGAVVVGPLSRLQDAKPTLKGEAVRPDGTRAGGVVTALVPRLAKGGEWLAASVELLADGGARNKAVVWASKQDLAAGKAEVLLEQGGPIPQNPPPAPPPEDPKKTKKDPKQPEQPAPTTTTTPPTPQKEQKVKTLFFYEGHDEPLWQAG
jgi:hypothetical protein